MRLLTPTRRWTCGLFVVLLLLASSQSGRTQATGKRALTHADYDGWRAIQTPPLSLPSASEKPPSEPALCCDTNV